MIPSPGIQDGIRGLVASAAGRPFPVRGWFDDDVLKVYVRVGQRLVADDIRNGITLATIDVIEPEQGKGHFTGLLAFTEALAAESGLEFVLIESVLNEHLIDFLGRQGYRVYGLPPLPGGLGADYVKLIGAA